MTNTQGTSCSPDKTMEASNRSQSGTMCEPSMERRGVEWWISSLAASRAKTSVLPEKAQASMANGRDCGVRWLESSVKYDRASHSWKTHRCLWVEDLQPSSLTLPRWGMMQDGVLWERGTVPLPTSGSESGYLPTPLADDWKGGLTKNQDSLRNWWERHGFGKAPSKRRREFWEWVMGWPEGWADLKPLGTDKSPSLSRWLSQYSPNSQSGVGGRMASRFNPLF